MAKAFNNEKYLKIQREEITKRISEFDGKLYLEFGGKLFDDYHASRVLPGFEPDSKLKMLLGIKDKLEIVIVVNTDDINSNKVRNDTGISYEEEVERLIDAFKDTGLYVSSVVVSFYRPSCLVDQFITKLEHNNIKTYKHYKINGYPQNIPLIVSDEGLGKNEYIKTTRPLVIVTAPGPGSGKMATCLSQIYNDNKNGIRAGYAKYETFPVWNLPLKHAVNLAYEAATVDLNDVNMIDPYHLEAYGKAVVNYNRDVETFPLLKAIFEKIYGKSPYNSPTDMGVNMVGFAITDDEATCKASKEEIIRRYYQVKKNIFLGKFNDNCIDKMEMIINQLDIDINDRRCVQEALLKAGDYKEPAIALELSDGRIVTGRTKSLSASAAVLMNALKTLAGIDDSVYLISPDVLGPIVNLKTNALGIPNPHLHAEEILIALAIQATTNPEAKLALEQLPQLAGCQAHSSTILPTVDMNTFKKIKIDITEEPVSHAKRLYNK